MILLECRIYYFLLWTVQRRNYQPLCLLCVAVKQWVGGISRSHMYCASSLDKFLNDARSNPTTDSLSVICSKHFVNCIYSGNFSASSTCSILKTKFCVKWRTADSSLRPFCNSNPPLCVLCMYSSSFHVILHVQCSNLAEQAVLLLAIPTCCKNDDCTILW